MYLLNKWADALQAGAEAVPTIPAQHSVIYIARGSASVNGQLIDNDSAVYVEDFVHIKAGKDGATIWRWGIVPRHEYTRVWKVAQRMTDRPVKIGTCCGQLLEGVVLINEHYKDRDALVYAMAKL
jgi:hypothetical protein